MSGHQKPLDFIAFAGLFSRFFDLEPAKVTGQARLDDDLGMDSVMWVEVMLFLEEAAEHPIPDELMSSIRTVGDVHHYYEVYASRERVVDAADDRAHFFSRVDS